MTQLEESLSQPHFPRTQKRVGIILVVSVLLVLAGVMRKGNRAPKIASLAVASQNMKSRQTCREYLRRFKDEAVHSLDRITISPNGMLVAADGSQSFLTQSTSSRLVRQLRDETHKFSTKIAKKLVLHFGDNTVVVADETTPCSVSRVYSPTKNGEINPLALKNVGSDVIETTEDTDSCARNCHCYHILCRQAGTTRDCRVYQTGTKSCPPGWYPLMESRPGLRSPTRVTIACGEPQACGTSTDPCASPYGLKCEDVRSEPCTQQCGGADKALAMGTTNNDPNGYKFYQCAANAHGEGYRGGFNMAQDPNFGKSCYTTWGSKTFAASFFQCLCDRDQSTKLIHSNGHEDCHSVCTKRAQFPVVTGTHIHGAKLYACSANAYNQGFRAGWNIGNGHVCAVSYGNDAFLSVHFECACISIPCISENGYDINGNDLKSAYVVDAHNCEYWCQKEAQCQGFVFDPSRGGHTCFLKTAISHGFSQKSGALVGVCPKGAKCFTSARWDGSYVKDAGIPNGYNIQTFSFEQCKRVCMMRSDCKFFTWNQQINGCWLKGGTAGLAPNSVDISGSCR